MISHVPARPGPSPPRPPPTPASVRRCTTPRTAARACTCCRPDWPADAPSALVGPNPACGPSTGRPARAPSAPPRRPPSPPPRGRPRPRTGSAILRSSRADHRPHFVPRHDDHLDPRLLVVDALGEYGRHVRVIGGDRPDLGERLIVLLTGEDEPH